jgi:hypothetical protein
MRPKPQNFPTVATSRLGPPQPSPIQGYRRTAVAVRPSDHCRALRFPRPQPERRPTPSINTLLVRASPTKRRRVPRPSDAINGTPSLREARRSSPARRRPPRLKALREAPSHPDASRAALCLTPSCPPRPCRLSTGRQKRRAPSLPRHRGRHHTPFSIPPRSFRPWLERTHALVLHGLYQGTLSLVSPSRPPWPTSERRRAPCQVPLVSAAFI